MNHPGSDQSYYDILGVKRSDDNQTIKKAWYKLSRQYHPDRLSEDEKVAGEQKIKEINEAYQVLSDPEKREVYEKYGKEGLVNFDTNNNDPLAAMFAKQSRQDVVAPIKINIEVTLDKLYTGISIDYAFKRRNLCKNCNMTGCKDKKHHRCKTCQGARVTVQCVRRGQMIQQIPMDCIPCKGIGIEQGFDLCEKCKGNAYELEMATIRHNIPPGSFNNDVIDIPNAGHEIPPELSQSGRTRGSVILIVREIPHVIFKRINTSDADLAIILKLSLADALCGFKRTIEHLDGRKLDIIEDRCINPETIKVIRQEGMPLKSSNILRGNLIVKFEIEFPESLSLENKRTIYSCLTNGKSLDDVDLSQSDDHVMAHMTSFSESDVDESESWQETSNVKQVQCPVQ